MPIFLCVTLAPVCVRLVKPLLGGGTDGVVSRDLEAEHKRGVYLTGKAR